MANLTLKNIPDELYEKLKEAANNHRRSLNSELIVCLEKTLMPQRLTTEEHLSKARALRHRIEAKNIGTGEIAKAKRQGRV